MTSRMVRRRLTYILRCYVRNLTDLLMFNNRLRMPPGNNISVKVLTEIKTELE